MTGGTGEETQWSRWSDTREEGASGGLDEKVLTRAVLSDNRGLKPSHTILRELQCKYDK